MLGPVSNTRAVHFTFPTESEAPSLKKVASLTHHSVIQRSILKNDRESKLTETQQPVKGKLNNLVSLKQFEQSILEFHRKSKFQEAAEYCLSFEFQEQELSRRAGETKGEDDIHFKNAVIASKKYRELSRLSFEKYRIEEGNLLNKGKTAQTISNNPMTLEQFEENIAEYRKNPRLRKAIEYCRLFEVQQRKFYLSEGISEAEMAVHKSNVELAMQIGEELYPLEEERFKKEEGAILYR